MAATGLTCNYSGDCKIRICNWNPRHVRLDMFILRWTPHTPVIHCHQPITQFPSQTPIILLPFPTLRILNILFLKLMSPISPNFPLPTTSHGANKLNHFLKGIIFITSLTALNVHRHLLSLSMVLHPQTQLIVPGCVRIVSSLVLFLALFPSRCSPLLPAPPHRVMHDQYLRQTILWS